ncbi:hypothetical protein N7461_003252 [Penicillium sp. DV-2018c]|nr:hypothetical protein N7461_003252 [Penicillium sp. DV-2018c]
MPRSWNHALAPAPSRPHNPGTYPLVRVKKATTACEACQKRKTKVCISSSSSSSFSSSSSADHSSNLTINSDNDGRRRITLKRKIQTLELDRDLLVRLVEAIRNDNDQQTPDVLNLIRSNAPLDEIRLCLSDGQREWQMNNHNHPVKMSRHSPKRYMDVNRIVDIALFQVPAQPWTSITEDDAFVSHLISLYFTWQHPILNWIDRDLFLADMQSGRLESRFCSPLLVNSMLAIACTYSDYPESFAVPGEPRSRGDHFFQEALALLEKEEGRLPLTTLQARGEIHIRTSVTGKDRQGWQYLVEISDCVRQVLDKREKMIIEANEQGEQMARSIDTAVFGLFSLNPLATLTFQTPSIIKVPKNLGRFPEDHHPTDTWIPYPRQAEPVPAHTNCLLNGQLELALVAWEFSDYLFGDEKPPIVDLERIDRFHDRLEEVMASLPACIRLGKTPTPGAMDLHMRYYHAILIMYGFVYPTLKDLPIQTQTRIKTLLTTTTHQISTLLTHLRTNYPIECIPVTSMQYATIALFTLLLLLLPETTSETKTSSENLKAIFTEILMTLRALARRWQFAKGTLRLIQLTAIKREIVLPRDTMVLLRDFEEELWKDGERERFSSLYPHFVVAVEQRGRMGGLLEEVEMDRVLDEWEVGGMGEEDGYESSEDGPLDGEGGGLNAYM